MLKLASNPLFAPVRRIERRMEKKPSLHLMHLAGEIASWSALTLLLAPSTATGILSYQLMLAAYHGCLAYVVHRHIFHYELKKAMKDTWPLRRLWALLVPGHVALLSLTTQSYWMGFAAAIVLPLPVRYFITRPLPVEYERGTKITTIERAREEFESLRSLSDPGVNLGGAGLPIEEMTTHTQIVGGTRSGKSITIQGLLASTLPLSYPGNERRAIIYDAKPEFVPILISMGVPGEQIKILNPADKRGYCWMLAEDFTTPTDAEAMGAIFFPDIPNAGNAKFFNDAARMVFVAFVKFLMKYAPRHWFLWDILLGLSSPDVFIPLLSCDPEFAPALEVLGSGETRDSVMATLATFVQKYRVVAAYMQVHYRAKRLYSLTRWHPSPDAIVMSTDRMTHDALMPLYQLLLSRAAQMLTSVMVDGYTFLFLDELPELGRIGHLERVARLAAAYNVCLVIAYQAYSDLVEIYNENLANSLTGQCDKSVFLRVLDHRTARWAADQIGEVTTREKMLTERVGQSLTGRTARVIEPISATVQRVIMSAFAPEHFLNLPKPREKTATGIHGVCKAGNLVYPFEITSRYISENLIPADDTVKPFIPMSAEHQTLRQWTREDMYRLGFHTLFEKANLSPQALKDTPFEGLLGQGEDAEPLNIEPIDFGFSTEGDDSIIDGELE